MSIAIRVLCRKPGLTRGQLLEYIRDEVDFCDDYAPRFVPGHGAPELRDERWQTLDVHYGGDALLQFTLADEPTIEGTVDELITQQDLAAELVARLKETRLMVTVRLGFGGADVERPVWNLLSCVETCVARDHDGVIVSREGIYDVDLTPIARF